MGVYQSVSISTSKVYIFWKLWHIIEQWSGRFCGVEDLSKCR